MSTNPGLITPDTPPPPPPQTLSDVLPGTLLLLPAEKTTNRHAYNFLPPSLTGLRLITHPPTIASTVRTLESTGKGDTFQLFPTFRRLTTHLSRVYPSPPGTSFTLFNTPLYLHTDPTTGAISYSNTNDLHPRRTNPSEFELLTPRQVPTHYSSSYDLIIFDHPVIVSPDPELIRHIVTTYGTCPLAHGVKPPSFLHTLKSNREPGNFIQVTRPRTSRQRGSTSRAPSTRAPDSPALLARRLRMKRIRQGLLPTPDWLASATASHNALRDALPYRHATPYHPPYWDYSGSPRTDWAACEPPLDRAREEQATTLTALFSNLDRLLGPPLFLPPFSHLDTVDRYVCRLHQRLFVGPLRPLVVDLLSHYYPLLILHRQRRIPQPLSHPFRLNDLLDERDHFSPWDVPNPPSDWPGPPPRLTTHLSLALHGCRRLRLPCLPLPARPSPTFSLCLHLIAVGPHVLFRRFFSHYHDPHVNQDEDGLLSIAETDFPPAN